MRPLSLWGPVAAWMAVLWVLSTRSTVPGGEFVWDKAAHAAAHAALCFLFLRALHGGAAPLRLRPVLLAVALTLAYGALSEGWQVRVPGRDASAADWVADAIGALAAIPFAQATARWRRYAAGRSPEVDA